MRPDARQIQVANQRHYSITTLQQEHVANAARNRDNLVSVNHGKPVAVHQAAPVVKPENAAKPQYAAKPENAKPQNAAKPQYAAKPANNPPAHANAAAKPANAAKPPKDAPPGDSGGQKPPV